MVGAQEGRLVHSERRHQHHDGAETDNVQNAEDHHTDGEPRSRFDSKLLAVLPASYDDGACEPVHPPVTDALATVDCGETNQPTGPKVGAVFALRRPGDAGSSNSPMPSHRIPSR